MIKSLTALSVLFAPLLASADFVPIDTFESHAPGAAIDSTGGWAAFGTPLGTITSDPDNAANQVAQLPTAANNAGYTLNLGAQAVADDGSEATVFFRYRTSGALSVYLTDQDAITPANWFSEDEVGLYNRSLVDPTDIRGHFNTGVATTINRDEWVNVWIHIQNKTTPSNPFSLANSERYFMYINGVLINGTDGTSDNSFVTRAFNANVPDIDTLFFVSNDAAASGMVDDFYIDNTGLNLTNPTIPEPSVAGLLALGVVLLSGGRFWSKRS